MTNPEPRGPTGDAPPSREAPPGERSRNIKALYTRVLVVQALTLLALWLLQQAFGS